MRCGAIRRMVLHFSHFRRRYFYFVLSAVLLFVLYQWFIALQLERRGTVAPEPQQVAVTVEVPGIPGNTVELAVYMEAQCSDTTRFVHRQLVPTWEKLSTTNRILLKVVPFGKASCRRVGEDFRCECQHGPPECELNQLMNCVIDMVPDPHSYVPVISCIQGKRDISSAGSKCLAKLHVPAKKILHCAHGPEGRRLLARAGAETNRLQPPLHFVPWITIDGKRSGDAFYDLMDNLCNALDPKPEQCRKEE